MIKPKDPLRIAYASGRSYGQTRDQVLALTKHVLEHVEAGGHKVEIAIHSRELYKLRDENTTLRHRLDMDAGPYGGMMIYDEVVNSEVKDD